MLEDPWGIVWFFNPQIVLKNITITRAQPLIRFSQIKFQGVIITTGPIHKENISGLIHFIQGEKVILDSDLARLYEVPTKVLKQAVRRNLGRFPVDFMFELTDNETDSSRSQFVTLKRGQNIKMIFETIRQMI